MQEFRRYAVYWAPDGAFADRAAAWLGWDPRRGVAIAQPSAGVDLSTVTDEPRKYGFHGTIKAPFRLAEGWSRNALADAAGALARRLAPVMTPGLAIRRIGRFMALVPEDDGRAIGALAAAVVEALEPARAALTEAEVLRRRPEGLTPRQRVLLDLWGYPYVMDEFRFHLTLTGSLDPAMTDLIEPLARGHFAPDLAVPFRLDALCLFGEAEDGRFHQLSRHALRG